MRDDKIPDIMDMETKLKADKDGLYKKQLVDRLKKLQESVKKKLGGGMSPAEFERWNKFKTAVDSSIQVVELYWAANNVKA